MMQFMFYYFLTSMLITEWALSGSTQPSNKWKRLEIWTVLFAWSPVLLVIECFKNFCAKRGWAPQWVRCTKCRHRQINHVWPGGCEIVVGESSKRCGCSDGTIHRKRKWSIDLSWLIPTLAFNRSNNAET